MAGCPVRSNSCVNRSVSARAETLDPPTATSIGVEQWGDNGQRRQQQGVGGVDGGVDLPRQNGPSPLRQEIVLGQDIAPELEPGPHPGAVRLGRRVQRRTMDRRRFRQLRVEIHGPHVGRVGDVDVPHLSTGCLHPTHRAIEELADRRGTPKRTGWRRPATGGVWSRRRSLIT